MISLKSQCLSKVEQVIRETKSKPNASPECCRSRSFQSLGREVATVLVQNFFGVAVMATHELCGKSCPWCDAADGLLHLFRHLLQVEQQVLSQNSVWWRHRIDKNRRPSSNMNVMLLNVLIMLRQQPTSVFSHGLLRNILHLLREFLFQCCILAYISVVRHAEGNPHTIRMVAPPWHANLQPSLQLAVRRP